MNFLILGDGPEEWAWARALKDHPEHRLWAACPGFQGMPELPGGTDLDGALALAGIEAVIVGGGPELRAEGLRRAAAAGFPVLCLHPPGPNADPYYQVALSRQETSAVVVPDLPARSHPGVEALRKELNASTLGSSRGIRLEVVVGTEEGDLLGEVFPRVIDVVRALLGEVETITGTGDPPGDRPTEVLVVHLRGANARRAEVRLATGPHEPAILTVSGAEGALSLVFEPTLLAPARLTRGSSASLESVNEFDPWDPKTASLANLVEAVAGRDAHPDLVDGTRAMELTEALGRSLRRGRTIDLHYEEISEAGNFKSIMTSLGCALILGMLVALPIALAGPAFGIGWTLYIAYAIPPILILFGLLQMLRLALRERKEG